MSTVRYGRQEVVPGIGRAGQARIRAAEVAVAGRGLDAEVCALYLAGAGVARLAVDPALVARCAAQNGEVEVWPRGGGAALEVELLGPEPGTVFQPRASLAVARGAEAARWVLARILSGGGR